MFRFIKKLDAQIVHDVTNEIAWDPRIDGKQIRVTCKDGVVTLRGGVAHYVEKTNAEEAARRVTGVRSVGDELEVNIVGPHERSDDEITEAALVALSWSYQVPDGIDVFVDKGWVTLSGDVEWDYQRNAARDAVCMLKGVIGVTNEIAIKLKPKSADVKIRIEEALKRSAEDEGRNIKVAVDRSEVTLSGKVHSFDDINLAGVAAWNAPGVTGVKNLLTLAV